MVQIKTHVWSHALANRCNALILMYTFHLHALLLRSHIFKVLSWLPVTTLEGSPRNFAAITFPEWPVRVCCNKIKHISNTVLYVNKRIFLKIIVTSVVTNVIFDQKIVLFVNMPRCSMNGPAIAPVEQFNIVLTSQQTKEIIRKDWKHSVYQGLVLHPLALILGLTSQQATIWTLLMVLPLPSMLPPRVPIQARTDGVNCDLKRYPFRKRIRSNGVRSVTSYYAIFSSNALSHHSGWEIGEFVQIVVDF